MNKSTAQSHFNKYIRLLRSNDNGICVCVTCGNSFYYTKLDAGHYIPVTDSYHRFNESNVHPQCVSCNHHKNGCLDQYTLYMIDTYGRDYVDELHATKKQYFDMGETNLKEIGTKYRKLCKELEQGKAME